MPHHQEVNKSAVASIHLSRIFCTRDSSCHGFRRKKGGYTRPPPTPTHRGVARVSSRGGAEIGKDVLLHRTSLVPISIFSLPGKIRRNIYARVLVVAHPLFLLQDTGSQVVETFAPEKPFRWLALLRTNRQVHDEASAVLYGLNHFTFMDTTQHQGDLLQSFLNCIGTVNAGRLAHIGINFPVVETAEGQPGKVMLRDDDLYSLKLLQEKVFQSSDTGSTR